MAQTNQNIESFYRVAQQRDFSRDFQFRILSIQTGGSSDVSITEDDLLYARGGQIPERSISNQTANYMGLDFNYPGSATYGGTYEITFFCDQESKIRQLWENWTRDVFDDATSTGNYFVPKDTATLDMIQLDTQLNRVAQYQLVGVYPQNVGALDYSLEGTGAAVTLSVTLQYHFWKKVA